jgi:hypothetical protein
MKFAAGWGDSLSASNGVYVERSPHPVTQFASLMRADPPPPGEGIRVSNATNQPCLLRTSIKTNHVR